jgi:maleate isomerase
VGTPYDDALTRLLIEFLEDAGIVAVSVRNLGMTGDPKTVPSEQVADLARSVDDPAADAVFLSCTNLHTFDLVPMLELEFGKPVLTANQVTMWGALRKAGLPVPNVGQLLFRSPHPADG